MESPQHAMCILNRRRLFFPLSVPFNDLGFHPGSRCADVDPGLVSGHSGSLLPKGHRGNACVVENEKKKTFLLEGASGPRLHPPLLLSDPGGSAVAAPGLLIRDQIYPPRQLFSVVRANCYFLGNFIFVCVCLKGCVSLSLAIRSWRSLKTTFRLALNQQYTLGTSGGWTLPISTVEHEPRC